MTQAADDNVTMGTFLLNGLEFGVDILQQREVLRLMPVTRMPCSVDFIEGVINLRETIIPIINLRTRLGMPRTEFTKATRILNIEVGNNLVVGFIVDSVGQVRRMSVNMIEPAPAIIASMDAEYISGMAKFDDNLLLVLDVHKILSDNELAALEQFS